MPEVKFTYYYNNRMYKSGWQEMMPHITPNNPYVSRAELDILQDSDKFEEEVYKTMKKTLESRIPAIRAENSEKDNWRAWKAMAKKLVRKNRDYDVFIEVNFDGKV
jgi:pyoverdine/dityrosine biosynthesis protein Dit1